MIRTIVTADKKKLTVLLPDDFIGKQIEVIAFVIDEQDTDPRHTAKAKTFSAVQLDTRGYKFNRNLANER